VWPRAQIDAQTGENSIPLGLNEQFQV